MPTHRSDVRETGTFAVCTQEQGKPVSRAELDEALAKVQAAVQA